MFRTTHGLLRIAAVGVVISYQFASIAAADEGSAAVSGSPAQLVGEAHQIPINELPRLAKTGRFDEVLLAIRSSLLDQTDPAVSGLVSDLERYQEHQSDRASARRDAYDRAIQEMVDLTSKGKHEEAIISAIDASSLADDPKDTLADPDVLNTVKAADAVAMKAEQDHDWIEALSLYRALDLLFDDRATYRGRVKQTARHVRVLRVYAPHLLKELYIARAERRGQDPPKNLQIGEPNWEQNLDGIDQSMLRQSLAQAARRHVSSSGYRRLLNGGIDALLTLAGTRGVEEAFPGFSDEDLVAKYRRGLEAVRASVQEHDGPLNYFDAATAIDRIAAVNTRTVGLPDPVLVYEITEGAMSTLDDFSSVVWPYQKKNFSRNTQGKFFGVGIQISIRDGRLVVVSPLEGTPAQKAGIRAGDIIATVESRDTAIWTLEQAVREITGPEGTKVVLGIERVGDPELLDFELTRAEIVIESIRGWQRRKEGGWDYLIDPANRVGYVRVSQFIPQTADDLDRAINQLEKEGGVGGLILDLRFNPGGLLSSAVEVSDRFITSGPIVSTVGPKGNRTSRFRASAHRTHRPYPLVVLINEGSASASEIVGGALQDYQRATVVGNRSFGKGSVQDLFPLDGGKAYLKLTTQYYALPLGRIIHRDPQSARWGIEPDLNVPMTTQQVADAIEFRQKVDVLRLDDDPVDPEAPDDEPVSADDLLVKGLDPQIEAAMLLLKTQLLVHQATLARSN